MSESLRQAKAALRQSVLKQRDALPPARRLSYSTRITKKLLALESYRAARVVMAYMSIGSEFDTREFVEHVLASGKTLVLPRVVGKNELSLHAVRDLQNELQPGVWGIREPVPARTGIVAASSVQWMLVPGVAFTREGARLGYGGGYYDTLLASIAPVRVAAAFGVQIMETLPTTVLDQAVDGVVTESDA